MTLDIGGIHSGSVSGVMNTLGNLGGTLSGICISYLSTLYGWTWVFRHRERDLPLGRAACHASRSSAIDCGKSPKGLAATVRLRPTAGTESAAAGGVQRGHVPGRPISLWTRPATTLGTAKCGLMTAYFEAAVMKPPVRTQLVRTARCSRSVRNIEEIAGD
jgi:hypothetical protein